MEEEIERGGESQRERGGVVGPERFHDGCAYPPRCEREGGREGERERWRDRQREEEIERRRVRERQERERERKRERKSERERERERERGGERRREREREESWVMSAFMMAAHTPHRACLPAHTRMFTHKMSCSLLCCSLFERSLPTLDRPLIWTP